MASLHPGPRSRTPESAFILSSCSMVPAPWQLSLSRGSRISPLLPHHSVQIHRHASWLGRPHPLPPPPSPAATLAERVEPGLAAVTLPACHRGLALAGARVITLEVQGAWGGRAWGSKGPWWGVRAGARVALPTHLLGGNHRAGTASAGSSDRSSPGSARSAAQLCGHGSEGSAHRGPRCGRAPGQICIPQSGRCSCKLWAGGRGGCVEEAVAYGRRGVSQPPCRARAGSWREVKDGVQACLDPGSGDQSTDFPKEDTLKNKGSTVKYTPTQDLPRQSRTYSHLVVAHRLATFWRSSIAHLWIL